MVQDRVTIFGRLNERLTSQRQRLDAYIAGIMHVLCDDVDSLASH